MAGSMDKKEKLIKNPVYNIGDVVRHKHYPFRGVVFDVDPEFDNTEEWYNSIPAEIRPSREQPFYHLLAENEDSFRSEGAHVRTPVTEKSRMPSSA